MQRFFSVASNNSDLFPLNPLSANILRRASTWLVNQPSWAKAIWAFSFSARNDVVDVLDVDLNAMRAHRSPQRTLPRGVYGRRAIKMG
jgi:hypothetical protein